MRGFPLVLDGEMRVARGSPQGRSLELYRVSPGELCVVSTSCLFGRHAMVAHGIAARPTRLVVLSPPASTPGAPRSPSVVSCSASSPNDWPT